MPRYSYTCPQCLTTFEEWREIRYRDEPAKCAGCDNAEAPRDIGKEGLPDRVLTTSLDPKEEVVWQENKQWLESPAMQAKIRSGAVTMREGKTAWIPRQERRFY